MGLTPLIPAVIEHEDWVSSIRTMDLDREADNHAASVIRSRTNIKAKHLAGLQARERAIAIAQFITGIHISRFGDKSFRDPETATFTSVASWWLVKVEGYTYWAAGTQLGVHHTSVIAACKRLLNKRPDLLPSIETFKTQIKTAERSEPCLQ